MSSSVEMDSISIRVESGGGGAAGGATSSVVVKPAPDIASQIWDEYYAACLKDTARTMQQMLDAGRSAPGTTAAPAPAQAAGDKKDVPATAATGTGAGGDAKSDSNAAALSTDNLSVPVRDSAASVSDNAGSVSISIGGGASSTAAPITVVAAGEQSRTASIESKSAPAAAPAPAESSSPPTRAGPNWAALQQTAAVNSVAHDTAHNGIKSRLYDAYDQSLGGGAGALDVGVLKLFVTDAIDARRRILNDELDIIVNGVIQSALMVVRSLSPAVAPAVVAAYERDITTKLNTERSALVVCASVLLDKHAANAENLSLTLFTAMDVDADGKLRKQEFLSEWKRAFDELIDYQPLLAKIRKLIS